MKIIARFATLFFLLAVGTVHAASLKCPVPEVVTSEFYKWYLHELNQDRYPLTSQSTEDKENLSKWVSLSLIDTLNGELSRNELDSEYFTDAQDVFDDWVNNIYTSEKKEAEHNADVELILGKGEVVRKYNVYLDDSDGCWKINNVKATN